MVKKMEWYEELDFDENPFDANPIRFADQLVGADDLFEELSYRINAGSMVFVQGKKGMGKTSLLWNLIKKYRGKGKVIYVDSEQLESELNIEDLLIKKYGFIGSLFKAKPKGMILLLDNVSELSKRNMERVKYFFDEGYIHSVVFSGTDYGAVGFSKSLMDRIGRRIIILKELEPFQAVTAIRNRIGDNELISDELIESVYTKSGKNMLSFLKNLEIIFGKAVESKKQKITKEDLRSI
jgi:predicted AAA+ superfamily ATPase